jgi:hypothetical protein
MHVRMTSLAAAAMVLALAATSRANDPWDQAPAGFGDDNTAETLNVLGHRSEQVHDVDAVNAGSIADEDWYIIVAPPRTSHEVVIDDVEGEVPPFSLQRRDITGLNVLQSGNPLTWQEGASASATTYYIRMSGAGCADTCTAASRYRIRSFDTTCSIPRFNNSGSQLTLLVIHNTSDGAVNATVFFSSAAGALIGAGEAITLAAQATVVLNTATLQAGAFAGMSGSVSISSTAGYGQLTGKGVALEPGTGFTFDTLMSPRP